MRKYLCAAFAAVAVLCPLHADAGPVVTARQASDLDAAVTWSDDLARHVKPALAGSVADREAIVSSLYAWASVDAMSHLTGDARAIYPRRVSGPVMTWKEIRPLAGSDPRKATIDAWTLRTGRRLMAIFGVGGSANGILNYNNNLQATAAMTAYAAGLINQDQALRNWAIISTREVLDLVDKDGYTVEIWRSNNERAEYYSHETAIYVIATAVMAARLGNQDIWNYIGRSMSKSDLPAVERMGALLNADLGNSRHYTMKTGKQQIVYPNAIADKYGHVTVSPYLGVWMKTFINHYPGNFSNLKYAVNLYNTIPNEVYNPGIGGDMPK